MSLENGAAAPPESGGMRFQLLSSAEGDLDLDGEVDAVAVLLEDHGTTQILHLHALLRDGRRVEDVAARLLGDRIGLRGLEVEDGIIRADLLVRPPGEPVSVRPTLPIVAHFALTGRGLVPVAMTRVDSVQATGGGEERGAGPASPALSTHEWELVRFEVGAWAPDLSAVQQAPALRFVSEPDSASPGPGQLTGHGGCNRIFATFRAGAEGRLEISGLAATRRRCPGPAMDLERRFLSALGGAQSYRIEGRELVVSFSGGTMRLAAGGRIVPVDPLAPGDGALPASSGEPDERSASRSGSADRPRA